MDIHVTARSIRIHKAIKEHALMQILKFEHLFDPIQRCDVIFSREGKTTETQVVEIIISANGRTLTAKEHSDDFHKSIDLASGKIEHQLSTVKSKLKTRGKIAAKKSSKLSS
ncbi:MAG: ribosome-associated translation inhibitor RaiA [Bacteroidota bacterium]